MKKNILFFVFFISFYSIYNTSTSFAEVGNPFTKKPNGEFTKADQENMKREINEQVNARISSLESRLIREIENIKTLKNNTNTNNKRRFPTHPMDFGNNNSEVSSKDKRVHKLDNDANNDPFAVNDNSFTNQEDENITRIRKSYFVGCIDDKVLLKDFKTNDNFFVSIKEAENNEEFNKIGSCNF